MAGAKCGIDTPGVAGSTAGAQRTLRWAVALLAGYALLGMSCDPLYRAVQVGGAFTAPIYVTAPAGDARLFVVERAGVIRVIAANGTVLATPFLDIRSRVGTAGEAGLLGLAFSPTWASDGLFYVYYLNLAGDSVLSRFRVANPADNVAIATSEFPLLVVDQPAGFTNHKGGTIAFSPIDGFLYWGLGDGGSSNDPGNRAQSPNTLLGKMLRLDVSGGATAPYAIPPDNPFVGPGGALDEIWAMGFRNPFRFSFDRFWGNLWIGDVGQGLREEVDLELAGDPGGRNYGWKIFEGSCYRPEPGCSSGGSRTGFTFPLYEYPTHVADTCAITGGVVYRGSVTVLQGAYLFADYCANRILALVPGIAGVQDLTESLGQGAIRSLVAFGEDGSGEVYLVSLDGTVHRIQ